MWLGNDDGSPTKHVTGGSLPVEIWSDFMRNAHQGVPAEYLPMDPVPSFLAGLFGQPASRVTDGAAPVPPAPVQTSAARPRGPEPGFFDILFGRR